MLVKFSCACIVMPGGCGTLDEVFETLALMQTEKIENFPVIAMGSEFWNPLDESVNKSLLKEETVSPSELELFQPTDSPQEAVRIIRSSAST